MRAVIRMTERDFAVATGLPVRYTCTRASQGSRSTSCIPPSLQEGAPRDGAEPRLRPGSERQQARQEVWAHRSHRCRRRESREGSRPLLLLWPRAGHWEVPRSRHRPCDPHALRRLEHSSEPGGVLPQLQRIQASKRQAVAMVLASQPVRRMWHNRDTSLVAGSLQEVRQPHQDAAPTSSIAGSR